VISTPNTSTERRALYQQVLAAGVDYIDVLQVNMVWLGILHRHLIDLTPYLGDVITGFVNAELVSIVSTLSMDYLCPKAQHEVLHPAPERVFGWMSTTLI
jgi:hypothetical protein